MSGGLTLAMLGPCPGEPLEGRWSPLSDPFCCSERTLKTHVQRPAGCVCEWVCVWVCWCVCVWVYNVHNFKCDFKQKRERKREGRREGWEKVVSERRERERESQLTASFFIFLPRFINSLTASTFILSDCLQYYTTHTHCHVPVLYTVVLHLIALFWTCHMWTTQKPLINTVTMGNSPSTFVQLANYMYDLYLA